MHPWCLVNHGESSSDDNIDRDPRAGRLCTVPDCSRPRQFVSENDDESAKCLNCVATAMAKHVDSIGPRTAVRTRATSQMPRDMRTHVRSDRPMPEASGLRKARTSGSRYPGVPMVALMCGVPPSSLPLPLPLPDG